MSGLRRIGELKRPQRLRFGWKPAHKAIPGLRLNLRLFRLVSEILQAIKAGVLHPVVGWHCQDCT
jgi:hypothetical protein